jgi:type VI secretion system protein ImpH
MSTASRRKNTSVVKKLAQTPGDFSFNQAVRLLERSTAHRVTQAEKATNNPVGKFMPPQSEFVRFSTPQSFSFPASDIHTVKAGIKDAKINQWEMQVNFIGLTGSSGALPYHYTETILQRIKNKDRSMERFFNQFNHRSTSLFYQAATKYNFPVQYERSKLKKSKAAEADQFTRTMLSLLGLGTENLAKRLHTSDESLLFYAGLFTQKLRTSTGLKQIIRHHFGIHTEIRQFVGQWQELIDDVRTRLPGINVAGQNTQLGRNVMLGKQGWFSQGKIKIILGPLSKSEFYRFAPGTSTLKALDEIVRLYLDMEHDYEFVMQIRKSEIPGRITLSSQSPSIIGWNTWLSSNQDDFNENNETVEIPVTSRRIS